MKRPHRTGLTLIELVAALCILATVSTLAIDLDSRAMTHSPERVWSAVERAIVRCSLLAIEHAGGVLSFEDQEFAYHHLGERRSARALKLPEGWSLHRHAGNELPFDSRGRCVATRLQLLDSGGNVISTAHLDGVCLAVRTTGGAP